MPEIENVHAMSDLFAELTDACCVTCGSSMHATIDTCKTCQSRVVMKELLSRDGEVAFVGANGVTFVVPIQMWVDGGKIP